MSLFSNVDTEQKYRLGTRIKDRTGGEFIYLKGVASTVAGSWVSFDEAHLTLLLAASAKGRVGVAQAAVVANDFGWYQIYGKATGKALAAFADNGLAYATATAGSVDDAVVSGDCVAGAIGRSALDTPSTGMAYFELSYPFINTKLG